MIATDNTYDLALDELYGALTSTHAEWKPPWCTVRNARPQELLDFAMRLGVELPEDTGTDYVCKFHTQPIEAAEAIIQGYRNKPPIDFEGDDPRYDGINDEVIYPAREAFEDPAQYYHGLFHELTHSTSYKTRLHRVDWGGPFDPFNYAREEITAELGGVLLRKVAGIASDELTADSATYVRNYLKYFDFDANLDRQAELRKASDNARKAVDYILGKSHV